MFSIFQSITPLHQIQFFPYLLCASLYPFFMVFWPQDTFTRAKKWVQELQRQGEAIQIGALNIFFFFSEVEDP
jgi:hypothetical protein